MYFTFLLVLILVLHIAFYFYKYYAGKKLLPNLNDRYVLITGCDSGIGNHLAKTLDKLGVPVFAACFTETGASELSQQSSTRLKTLHLDVTKADSIKAALQFVQENIPQGKELWGLVNNAGICKSEEPIEFLSRQEIDIAFAVNLFGSIDMTKAFLPLLRKSKGRVVLNTSVISFFPLPCKAAYCMSKAALEAFTDSLRREMYHTGVTVMSVRPGGFKTNVYNVDALYNQLKTTFDNANEELKSAYGPGWLEAMKKEIYKLPSLLDANFTPSSNDFTHALFSEWPNEKYNTGWIAKFIFYPLSIAPTWLSDRIFAMPAPDYVKNKK